MIEILKAFKGAVDVSGEKQKLAALDTQFCAMAKKLLYGGCFRIDGDKYLYLDDIEFYYHEEDKGGLKDPIMYHTNENEGKHKPLPYFEIGRLHLHTSGVDITFENEKKHYRASVLIRGFHVGGHNNYAPHNYDPHSTHVYREMLYMGVPLGKPIEIEWVSENLDKIITYEPHGEWRQNVADYELKDGKYAKIEYKEGKYSKEEYSKKEFDTNDYFCYSGKIFKKCTRKWRFKKDNIS